MEGMNVCDIMLVYIISHPVIGFLLEAKIPGKRDLRHLHFLRFYLVVQIRETPKASLYTCCVSNVFSLFLY